MAGFDFEHYGADAAGILRLGGPAPRAMPLIATGCSHAGVRTRLAGRSARDLFPGARSPLGALAGLWTYFSAFDEAHAIAQDLPTPEGSYWHAILHRQEPDLFNASYWIRRVGNAHPVYAQVRAAALELGYSWDPLAFAEFACAARAGSAEEDLALRIQLAEWQFLFDYCARDGA